MEGKHVVVWLDQSEAHIIHLNRQGASEELVRSPARRFIAGASARLGFSNQAPYLEAIASGIGDGDEILIVGPDVEKLTLIKYLFTNCPDIGERVIGVETIDDPDDHRILQYARHYFLSADTDE